MAEYQEVAGEADEEEVPQEALSPRKRLYRTVTDYRQTDFHNLKDLTAALGSEQTQSLGPTEEPQFPELEQLPAYLAKVKRLVARKKELERRRDQVLRLKNSLFS